MSSDLFPVLSYAQALEMATMLLSQQSFATNAARTEALFDLSSRIFIRYFEMRKDWYADDLPSVDDERHLTFLKVLSDALKDINSTLPKGL